MHNRAGKELGTGVYEEQIPLHPRPSPSLLFPYCKSSQHAEIFACNIMTDWEEPVTFTSWMWSALKRKTWTSRKVRGEIREGGGAFCRHCCCAITTFRIRSFIFYNIEYTALGDWFRSKTARRESVRKNYWERGWHRENVSVWYVALVGHWFRQTSSPQWHSTHATSVWGKTVLG